MIQSSPLYKEKTMTFSFRYSPLCPDEYIISGKVRGRFLPAQSCLEKANYGLFAPGPFRLKSFRPDTVETLFSLQVKAVEGLLSFHIQSAIDRLINRSFFLTFSCYYASTTTLLIYARNQTNTFRLNGSLTTQMLNINIAWAGKRDRGEWNEQF